MTPASEEYSKYTKGFIKLDELICRIHGTKQMQFEHLSEKEKRKYKLEII